MKTIVSSVLLFFAVVFTASSQNMILSLSGNVTDVSTGAPVPYHAVNAEVMSGGLILTYEYLTTTYGFYGDSIPIFGQGTINVWTLDCNGEVHSQSGTFSPNNTYFVFDFSICTDSTSFGCQAFYGYELLGNGLVAFFDQSTGNPSGGMPDHWLWEFGDGTSSSEQNPVHAYNGFGNYTICLTIWDDEGLCQDVYCDVIYIGGSGGDCQNWFTYQASNTFDFTFFGESAPPANQYFWDFGDGQTGFGQIATHTYGGNPGQTYLVTLTTLVFDPMVGDSCVATSIQEISLGGGNPDCINWFTYTSNGTYSFNFFGEVEPQVPSAYVWDFGDGTTGYGQQVSHLFEPSGVTFFNVCLTTYSNNFLDSCVAVSCQQVYVGGSGGDCMNTFTYETWNNIDFAFMGESVPPANQYFWDFGDGSYGTGQTALHTYGPNTGDYVTVILTTYALDPATGDSCVATSVQEVWLNGSGNGCENWFWYEQNNPFGFNFHGESFPNSAYYYAWDFGDGQTGSGQEVSHVYDPNSGDVFLVILTTYSYGPDGDSCTAVSMQEIWVNSQGNGCENWFWYNNSSPNEFVFQGESFPAPANEYIWDFGDGSTGTGQTVNHTYMPGTGDVFLVTLTTLIYNPVMSDSCVAVSTQEVWINGQSGDCQNWFWYESLPGFVYSFHGESTPYPAQQYVWQFDNGMVLFGQDVTYTFDPSWGNTHIVCLTTYSYSPNSDSCSYTSCQEIILGGQTGVELFGTIYTTDSIPADFALVGLFGMKPDGSFSYDFTVTGQGMYFFENVQPGDYYIFASLTPQSQFFYDYFPTYFGDAVTWSGATLITLGEPQNPYNIHLVPVEGVSSGSGIINGSVTMGEGKGDPGTNITVMLMDESENTLSFTESGDEGLFSFENLAFGTYKLRVEIPGKPSAIATVTLQESNPEGDVTFIVKDTEVVLTAGKIPSFANFVGEIFPNPVAESADLEIDLIGSATLNLRILNQLGQVVQSSRLNLAQGTHLIHVETAALNSGFYTLQITSDNGGMLVKKFIK
jgi:PKD repeat protein